ncbi:SURF1 family protein [Devosia psychrophila]|uniref:SURF1-like protein n=2 Tax=Devosia psychrophila TaxID=728005 RepID=A0A1I1I102_9HYPH|nr:SURF1 family protein [Devosia psychrophila]SFC29987.1 surfeit locus 1 family protein [Devosia psychrophila]
MTETRRLGRGMTWTFIVLMLALAATCVWLGNWQMHRLAEKEALIAAVDARLHADPIPVPPSTEWASLDLEALNFQPVSLTGSFRYNQTVTVFTSLLDGRGPASGPGFWVVTPFVLANGGTVFINRGFIPEDFQEAAIADGDNGDAQVTISGLFRPGEKAGFVTPGPNTSDRIEWVRDPVRLAAMVDPALAPIAPFYVDLPASAPGELPQGGETVVEFPNNHLGYAYTWYGFAIVAVVMLGFWIIRERSDRKG